MFEDIKKGVIRRRNSKRNKDNTLAKRNNGPQNTK